MDEPDVTKRNPWIILVFTLALIAVCFGLGKIGYNGQDRDEFEAAWRHEFLKDMKPGEYRWSDIDRYTDSVMFTRGYTLFNDHYYKDGKRMPYDELPRP